MELNKIPQWMLALEPEDAAFLKNFALKSGSLKEIARLYQVSYPTVRLRLDKLIQKIELADQQEEEPFTAFIKGLAVDSRIDVETAKQIIDKYEKERKHICESLQFFSFPWPFWLWNTIWVPGESPCWGLCCPAGSSCCWPACPSRFGIPPACFQAFPAPRDWPPPG